MAGYNTSNKNTARRGALWLLTLPLLIVGTIVILYELPYSHEWVHYLRWHRAESVHEKKRAYLNLLDTVATRKPSTPFLRELIVRLNDRSRREDALRYLLEYHRRTGAFEPGRWERNLRLPPRVINMMIPCPQPDGSHLYAVFEQRAYDPPMLYGEKPVGRLHVFDEDGRYIRYDQWLHRYIRGRVEDINHDGVPERIGMNTHAVQVDHADHPVRVIHVLPLTRNNEPLLSVAVPTDRDGVTWYMDLVDVNDDDIKDVIVRGKSQITLAVVERIVYRWAPDKNAYVGPDGKPNDPVMRVNPKQIDTDLRNYVLAHL